MYQTTVRCKSLRLAVRHKNQAYDEGKAIVEVSGLEEYTEASLEGNDNNTRFFFTFPVGLIDRNMKIGDEILVTFERKNK